MITDFKDTYELFEYVRKYDLNKIQSLDNIFSEYDFKYIQIDELLDDITKKEDFLLIDTRSEKEFEETAIPYSVNFPVLNNTERHNVGLIFKKYSPLAASKLAVEYAEPKLDLLVKFLEDSNAKQKNIYVHCWRGGGRSKYLAKMITDTGYEVKILTGGIKAYRHKVNEFFNQTEFPYNLIELNGLTGVGKTELLNAIKDEFPVLDLELSARHFSSLFGFVPYQIRNYKKVVNQTAFENDLFSQIIRNVPKRYFNGTFLIESESKKVGDFFIPETLYWKTVEAPCINIYTNIDVRINRIINDYFGSDKKGIEEMLRIFKEKERLFRKELSNLVYEDIKTHLEKGDVYTFTKLMIINYYDKKYKDKGKKPIAIINNTNIYTAKDELLSLCRSKA
jgi:tRNA 2-selenouridine synthase